MSRSKTYGAALAIALANALSLRAQNTTPAATKPKAQAEKPAAAPMQLAASYEPALYSALRYRMIGPLRGGRVTAVTGVASNPQLYYMGSTGGGIWKTTDAGHSWRNISDGQLPVGSMGAIEVAQSDPNIIYAGTGSSKIRSNVSIGKGMFKSLDAGKTWTFSGLKNAGQISTIRVNPTNPNIVFVAALGSPFANNVDRGVFKSTDGGANWKKVLYVSDSSGAADLEIQPGNPNVLFASIWRAERKPWTIISGAKEGGIYKSTDAGETWMKLGGGLPTGLFGRSNVSIPASNPNRVYALIEAMPGGGVYRSDDAGATWTLANGAQTLWTRPFYYTTLEADPTNADALYVGNEGWFKSTDAGKTFRNAQAPHGDHQDMWINPKNSDYMIESNDGGANVSLDGGRSWSTQDNQPTAEIYQVAVDNQYPYRVYGAQQDNTTLIVPSLPLGAGQTDEWRTGPGCETGPIIPNRTNPDIVYGSCKGQFSWMNVKTGEERQYWVGGESLYGNGGATLTYRFQRVSAMEVSPHEAATIYYGSQYVHRTRDNGVTWEKISPDLTANPPGEPQEASGTPITRDATGEEMYSVIYAIRESPITPGLIWTGANDGPFYVTRDAGKTWTNVTPKDLPPGGRVQNIEPSPHRPGTAYYAYYRFLLGGDFAPYIYRTDDYGKTWTKIVNGIAADEPVRVVREDPVRAGLLYAGTEFGMHISFDNGAHWHVFQQNLPATPVTDIKFGRNDMVLSTQGRAFWIMDNVSALRELSEKVAASTVTLYKPQDAVRGRSSRGGGGGVGRGAGVQYPAPGAMIDYYVAPSMKDDLTLEILDGTGKVVRKFGSAAAVAAQPGDEAPPSDDETGGGGRGGRGGQARLDKTPGMHRMTWDLRYPGAMNGAGVEGSGGPTAIPGLYSVRLTAGTIKQTQPLNVVEDPRILRDGISLADLKEQFTHNIAVRDLVSDANKTVARLRSAQAKLKGSTNSAQVEELNKLNELAAKVITSPIRYSEPKLLTHITYLYSMTNGVDQRPGKDAVDRLKVLKKDLDDRKKELDKILGPAM